MPRKWFALFFVAVLLIPFGARATSEGDVWPIWPCEGKVCAIYPSGGDVEQTRCKDGNGWKKVGADCSPRNGKVGKCFPQKNKKEVSVVSCSAKVCNENSALWLHKKSNGDYQSYGLCRKKDWLQQNYCNKSKACDDCNGSRCVLKVVKYTVPGFTETNAYHDDELCVCESQTTSPEPQPQPQLLLQVKMKFI